MTSRLDELCKELRLGRLSELLGEVEYHSSEQFLTDILELAVKQRREKRIERLIKKANFPALKTLNEFDFSPIAFPKSIDRSELTTLSFIDKKENLLLVGAVGTGKTFLACALGLLAANQGIPVRFFRTVELVNTLIEAHRKGGVNKIITDLKKAKLAIFDEMGYIPFSKQGAELLFSVISTCYETQSLIITSNLDFGRWNEVFGDDRLTAALIDRLIHHAHILAFSGESFRFKQAMSRKKDDSTNSTG